MTPTALDQYPEEGTESAHVSWNTSFTGSVTNGTLVHIARKPKVDFTNKTFYLKATGFNFDNLPETINGIELRLTADRRGRVTDETIQLVLDNNPIGDNLASLELDEIKSYGGENVLWGTNITATDIMNPSFGVLMRFRAHPHYPHRDGIIIRAVELLIH